ncbi:MAG: hypothetical protein WC326_14670 [Candidatus Delongbacteria bacterium]
MKNIQAPDRLEELLRASADGTFAPGFSQRVLSRLELRPGRPEAELVALWTCRLFPRVAVAAGLLLVAMAAWNVGSTAGAGDWVDRLLSLPAATLDNSLALSQLEDWS